MVTRATMPSRMSNARAGFSISDLKAIARSDASIANTRPDALSNRAAADTAGS